MMINDYDDNDNDIDNGSGNDDSVVAAMATTSGGVDDDVEVKFRKEGENIKINDRKSLKDYMREQNIPPWKRDRVMLIYIKDELKVVWDKV